MKQHLNEKTKIDLDLTSMLDVILILLMVVMCSHQLSAGTAAKEAQAAQEQAAEYRTQLDEAQSRLDEAKNEIDALQVYKDRLDSLEDPAYDLAMVTLYVGFDHTDPRTRHIRLLYGDDRNAFEEITLTPETAEDGFTRFAAGLGSVLSAQQQAGLPVLLTLDDENILYRDHLRMEQILEELKKQYPNLYLHHGKEQS